MVVVWLDVSSFEFLSSIASATPVNFLWCGMSSHMVFGVCFSGLVAIVFVNYMGGYSGIELCIFSKDVNK